jgi:phage-related protein
MATFTFTPSFTADLEEQPIVKRVRFGDGYEQRLSYGLNTQPKKWSLQFSNRTDTERDNILTFLRARGGVWVEALADGKALRVACNQQMADAATPLSDGCELAFFPPVTGG